MTDATVRALPRGVGSVEQWSHNVDVLVGPVHQLLPHGGGQAWLFTPQR